jgi:hypothetical protein
MIILGEPEQRRMLPATPKVPYDLSDAVQTASYGTGHAKVRKGRYSSNPSSLRYYTKYEVTSDAFQLRLVPNSHESSFSLYLRSVTKIFLQISFLTGSRFVIFVIPYLLTSGT